MNVSHPTNASAAAAPGRGRRRALLLIGAGYVALLLASWVAMSRGAGERPLPSGFEAVMLPPHGADGAPLEGAGRDVRLAYRTAGPAPGEGPVALLLHGSPGSSREVVPLLERLGGSMTVIAPDMPGFGASSREAPDYSVRAHAGYVLGLMDELGIESAHLVGFSMGGGVALELIDAAPERARSLTLLAAIGVEELELLGDHTLNRGIHELQLAGLRAVRWGVPHFGALDRTMLTVEYARNFADTDQRRLRPILEELRLPTLVLHGENDFLVPVAAAREHARIVPQARLVIYPPPAHHFLPWENADEVAGDLARFVADVESGRATTRPGADPARVAAAAAPYDPRSAPPFHGPALLTILLALALATLASEDLACIAAGLLVADERVGFVPAALACFVGIYLGDMLLYLAGRLFGRGALKRRPLRWVVSDDAVGRASRWFERKGIAVIFLSRFTPGLRLPTYVAAGVLRTSFTRFSLYFAVAGLLWTPALVALAALAGERLERWIGGLGPAQLPWIILLVVGLLLLYRTLPLLFTHRGRRVLRGRLRRRTSWEFWPPWISYLPIVPWILWLAVRHRGLTKVTATNPALPAGGFVGESKSEILEGLGGSSAAEIPDYVTLRAGTTPGERTRAAREFMGQRPYPVFLKPDAGQRGSGVVRVESEEQLTTLVRDLEHDALVQSIAHGPEFGVFWTREPGAARGSIFAITEKVLPTVIGDGRRTVEELLLDDPRACALHGVYLAELGEAAEDVPAPGERRRLVEVGTHSRGALFLEGEHLRTPELADAVERIASRYEGFDFGRFDIIAPSQGAFREGKDLSVIELNGVTSEATNVYDPKHSILTAYRILFRQWSLAYRIGAANAARGVPTTSLPGILREWLRYRKMQRTHQGPDPTPRASS